MKKHKTTSSSSSSSAPLTFTNRPPFNPVEEGKPHPQDLDPLSLTQICVPAAVNALMDQIMLIYPALKPDYQTKMREKLTARMFLGIKHQVIMRNDVIAALQILHRLRAYDKDSMFAISHTPQQVCATALMLGSKYLEDLPFNNESWARVMGVSLTDLCETEEDLVTVLRYEIMNQKIFEVMENEYEQKCYEYLQEELQKLPPSLPAGPK